MKSEFFKGDVKDVCAELKKELERCGNMKVEQWLSLRKLEKTEAKQFGISVENFRKIIKKIKKYHKNI
jgi:hypothetical protein